jgi:hypothetical protein
MKPSQYTPTHRGLPNSTKSVARGSMVWEISTCDKQNKIHSLIDRFRGRDLSSMDPLFTAHTMWKQNTYNFASIVAPQIDGGSGPHFMHL